MKKLYIAIIIIILTILILPLVFINTEQNVASSIDNKMLAENPFSASVRSKANADLTRDIDSYINDRIGFRDKMILTNIVLNDKLFNRMDHPTYAYGTEGYIFFKNMNSTQFSNYHITFAKMVNDIKNYCNERNIPFIFVFNPEKKSVYSEFLPNGLNYNTDWVDMFISTLDQYGIDYVYNTPLLIEKKEAGEIVFNKKYNAGHWNDLGAFYGVNNILNHVKNYFPNVELNNLDEFEISYKTNTSLPVSTFPINEKEPIFVAKNDVIDKTSLYINETYRHPSFQGFGYTTNPQKQIPGNPKTLVFQGSYMNGMGYKFLRNSLSEYIFIHDYQNVIDFPYYFNLFKPECVIFEVAEYTFSDTYFNSDQMKSINWNPYLKSYYSEDFNITKFNLNKESTKIEKGDVFTKITWDSAKVYDYVWFMIQDEEFDAKLIDNNNAIYQVTIPNTALEKNNSLFSIIGTINKELEFFEN